MSGMKSIEIETLDSLIDKLPVKYAALVVIGVVSCARVSEILTLTRRDLIDENGKIRENIAIIKLKARRKKTCVSSFFNTTKICGICTCTFKKRRTNRA